MNTASKRILSLIGVVMLSAQLFAGSISGKITYTGQATGTIYVVAIADTINFSFPVQFAQPDSAGTYTLTDLPAGTYFLVAIMLTESDPKATDPWGVYQSWENFTGVAVGASDSVTGINFSMYDGTPDHPNPFFLTYVEPTITVQLPAQTAYGTNPSLGTDGTWMYLYKHDYQGAGSAKVHKINPSTGEVSSTFTMSLMAGTNQVSWVNSITWHKSNFWATGGYGTASGVGRIGVFKIDFASSTASNQLPPNSAIVADEVSGVASDGTYLYAGVEVSSGSPRKGYVRFDPEAVSEIPASPVFALKAAPSHIGYGNGFLWVGLDSVYKVQPSTGEVLAAYNIPREAADVYFNGMLWCYDDDDNTLEAYEPTTTNIADLTTFERPTQFELLRNYPNPFNPSTTIQYRLRAAGFVSLRVYDLYGREVATLVHRALDAGTHVVSFDASRLPSGAYVARLVSGSQVQSLKMQMVK